MSERALTSTPRPGSVHGDRPDHAARLRPRTGGAIDGGEISQTDSSAAPRVRPASNAIHPNRDKYAPFTMIVPGVVHTSPDPGDVILICAIASQCPPTEVTSAAASGQETFPQRPTRQAQCETIGGGGDLDRDEPICGPELSQMSAVSGGMCSERTSDNAGSATAISTTTIAVIVMAHAPIEHARPWSDVEIFAAEKLEDGPVGNNRAITTRSGIDCGNRSSGRARDPPSPGIAILGVYPAQRRGNRIVGRRERAGLEDQALPSRSPLIPVGSYTANSCPPAPVASGGVGAIAASMRAASRPHSPLEQRLELELRIKPPRAIPTAPPGQAEPGGRDQMQRITSPGPAFRMNAPSAGRIATSRMRR